jgi:CRISPR-associated protein Cas5d
MLTVTGYPVEMEISGKASFRRPDTGDTPKTYPVPTMSAAKGMMEDIAFFSRKENGVQVRDAIILPYKVELCSSVVTSRYPFNYHGPLKKNGTTMTFSEILLNACYRIYGVTYSPQRNTGAAHHLQDVFLRRLRKGQCFIWPSLGLKQFLSDYYGPFRKNTKVNPVDIKIGAMPLTVFKNGSFNPSYCSNAKIEKGVLNYAERVETNSRFIKATWSI